MSVGLTLYCAQEEIADSLGCCPNFAMGLVEKLDEIANGAAPAPPALPASTTTSLLPLKAKFGGAANPNQNVAEESRPTKKARTPKPQAIVFLQIL